MSYTKIMKIKNVTGHTHTTLLKSAPDKKASSIVYGLHFLQVWPFYFKPRFLLDPASIYVFHRTLSVHLFLRRSLWKAHLKGIFARYESYEKSPLYL